MGSPKRTLITCCAGIALCAALLVSSGCSSDTGTSTPSASDDPTPSEQPTPTPSDATTATATVFVLRGDHVAAVGRMIEIDSPGTSDAGGDGAGATESYLAAAIDALLEPVPTRETEWGYSTAIPAGTVLNDLSVDGAVVTVDLSSEFTADAETESMAQRIAQIAFTLLPASGSTADMEADTDMLDAVEFRVDGRAMPALGDAARIPSFPMVGRDDLADVRPMILVTHPLPGDTISGETVLEGESNAFEATFLVEVTDPAGQVVTEQLVTGGGGMGVWKPFSVPLEFVSDPGQGWIVAYEQSARDGSRINEYRVPVTFE